MLIRLFVYGSLALIAAGAIAVIGRPTFPLVACVIASVLALPAVFMRIWRSHWIAAGAVVTGVSTRRKKNPEGKDIIIFEFHYSYIVSGTQYTGAGECEIDVPRYQEEDAVAQLSDSYKIGDRISIYYAPTAPSLSATTRGARLPEVIGGIVLLLLLVMCGYLFYRAIRR